HMPLSAAVFRDYVALALKQRERRQLGCDGLEPSAVLVTYYEKAGSVHLLFTQRTDRVAHHKQQVSFPGGARDPGDASLLHTALRETYEEVGLDPASVEVLGALDDTPTVTSNFLITPYVAFVPHNPRFAINPVEVTELIEVPIQSLASITPRTEAEVLDGRPHTVYFYDYNGHTIWGATARVVKGFLDLLRPGLPGLSVALPQY
ncbi:MAG: CoA pyrophosphatase, partial [Chloroflexi bacterium]|nr:CoA pyrophosphatase [Chloroflexota bacterium]